MALSHTMKLIELSDIKIAKMLTDDGTATTYGALVDMPGANYFIPQSRFQTVAGR